MGNDLYKDLWDKYRPVILNLVQSGGGSFQLSKLEFEKRGNRDKYTFRMAIPDGVIPIVSGSAVARDLKVVLDGSPAFKSKAAGKSIIIRLTASFLLEVEVNNL